MKSRALSAGVIVLVVMVGIIVSPGGSARASSLVSTALPTGAWKALGPRPIIDVDPTVANAPWAGRVPAVAVSPANTSVAYVGGANGGVWMTTDGGTHWAPRFSAAQNLPVGSLAVDPVDPSIVWAGTGEGNLNSLTHAGDGVYRSTDAGMTWARVGGSLFDNCGIPAVVVDPAAHNNVLAAVRQPYGKRVPLLPGPCNAHGIYRSTNSGASWELVRAGEPTDLAVDPSTPSHWYAAFQVYQATTGTDALARSVDGGVTWTVPGTALPAGLTALRLRIAVSHGARGRVYLAGVAISGTTSMNVVETTGDGGASWTQLPGPSGESAWEYRLAIAADPTDINTFYLGGLSLYRYQGATTTNPTVTWVSGNDSIHVDQQTMVFDTSHRLWLGNDGGVYRSSDGAQTFANLNSTLSLAQFYTSLSGTTGVVLAGGTQDIGAAAYDGATQWRALYAFSDIIHTVVDPTDPGTIYALSHGRNVFKTTDGGQTWNRMTINVSEPACDFSNPLVLDPGNHQRLYSGGTSHVLRSDDGGATWTSLPTGLGECVTAVAPAPNSPLTVVVGTEFGLHRTVDGGQTWSSVPLFDVHSLVVDPTDPQRIYAAHSPCGGCSALSAGGVAASSDGGTTWTNISGNLPSVVTSNIAVDRSTSPPTLYAATDVGVYGSTDSGATWSVIGTSLPRVEVTDVMVDDATNQLVAATFGRGVYALALRPSPVTVVSPNGGEQLQSGRAATINWNAPAGAPVRIDLLRNDVLIAPITTSVTTGTSGSGTFTWPVPTQLPLGKGYRVWVRALNGPGGDASDRTFAIVPVASLGGASFYEGDTGTHTIDFAVTLDRPSTSTVAVGYSVKAATDDTATAGVDFVADTGTITFSRQANGLTNTTANIPVTIKGDTTSEPNETFTVSLTSASGAVLGRAASRATILNDDPGSGLRIAVGNAGIVEGNAAATSGGANRLRFHVSLSRPVPANHAPIVVKYTITGSTATGGSAAGPGIDFLNVTTPASLTFSAGQNDKAVGVAVFPDTAVEPNETFSFKLVSVTGGATILNSSGVGTIRNDD
ncbi:MAG: hypothetical protein QOG50_1262 [Actinomycetota bacterium]|nr:hypothetical protein [Actinomycetota bacterium]